MEPDNPSITEFEQIYQNQAQQYEALVSREDKDHNLWPALQAITPFNDQVVVELGAGTGRLTCLMAPVVKFVHAFDISQPMLSVAAAKLQAGGWRNWRTEVCDHRQVPVADGSADLMISGWSVCYLVVADTVTWKKDLEQVFAEARRILRPGRTLILVETLGTGFETPHPPEHLAAYYQFLEENGFNRRWLRTDYQFESLEKAQELTRFFFGEAMVEKICSAAGGATLPECTGIWWKAMD